MKKEILEQFNALESLVSNEVKQIAENLIMEHDTYGEAINTLNDYYESEYLLDDYVYSEIYQKMKRLATK